VIFVEKGGLRGCITLCQAKPFRSDRILTSLRLYHEGSRISFLWSNEDKGDPLRSKNKTGNVQVLVGRYVIFRGAESAPPLIDAINFPVRTSVERGFLFLIEQYRF
jgi:hypothetical protein